MYTKEEASLVRQTFWKAYGQYMALHVSAEGLKINWINYKTGIKYLNFKMDADKIHAYIQIHLSHPDIEIQEMMMEQFKAVERLLQSHLKENWDWEKHATDEYGNVYSAIGITLNNVNIFDQNDWPKLIQFFKPRMIALDAFWNDAQYGFEMFS
jgi:hypothetical protein